MGLRSGPRHGSLQVWPRKRSKRALPRVNWRALSKEGGGLMGFIGYKAGMKSAFVKDNTPDSMTKNKQITLPVTIVECPPMKIFSVRLYKGGRVVADFINENLDKELKRKVKFPKEYKIKSQLEKAGKMDFDDLRVLAYSQVGKTGVKKTPDIAELALAGSKDEKLAFVKSNLSKGFSISDVFGGGLVDVRGITKGKGVQGPVKRFGIRLRVKKSEKGQRRAGSIGPWHPARLDFRVPFAGQMGLFSRVVYNFPIIAIKSAAESPGQLHKYGVIKNDYLILNGSVQGPRKKQVLITSALRPSKKQLKKSYELLELR